MEGAASPWAAVVADVAVAVAVVGRPAGVWAADSAAAETCLHQAVTRGRALRRAVLAEDTSRLAASRWVKDRNAARHRLQLGAAAAVAVVVAAAVSLAGRSDRPYLIAKSVMGRASRAPG